MLTYTIEIGRLNFFIVLCSSINMTFSFGRHFCRNRCVFINIVILTFLPSTVVTVVLTDFRLSLSNFSSSLRKLIRFSGRTFRKRKLTGAAVGWDQADISGYAGRGEQGEGERRKNVNSEQTLYCYLFPWLNFMIIIFQLYSSPNFIYCWYHLLFGLFSSPTPPQ